MWRMGWTRGAERQEFAQKQALTCCALAGTICYVTLSAKREAQAVRMVLLGLLLLLAACERRGYEISASGVAAYVWDNNPMHFGGIVRRDVPVADPTTFVQLSANPAFGRDTRHAFYEAEIIAGANPASFRPLGDSLYSTDDESVFFEAQLITAADLASFRALAVDSQQVVLG